MSPYYAILNKLTLPPPSTNPGHGNVYGPGVITGTDCHGFEISDLTIDCNIGDQPRYGSNFFPNIALSAISVFGNNIRIRRVRVINFGTCSPIIWEGSDEKASLEGFPIFGGGPNALVEDCILEQPFCGTGRESTLINLGSLDSTLPPARIRNCYLDCDWINPRNGFATRVVSATRASNLVTAMTQFPHNAWKQLRSGDQLYVELKGATDSAYNGRWPVTLPVDEDALSREVQFDVGPGQTGIPSGPNMTVELSFQPTLRITSASWASNVLTITTTAKHWRKKDDWVVISGAHPINGVDVYNGTYQVLEDGLTGTSFKVANPDGSIDPILGELWIDRRPSAGKLVNGTVAPIALDSTTYQLTTYNAHALKPNEFFALRGSPATSKLVSFFKVVSISGRKSLTFAATEANLSLTSASLYVHFQGLATYRSLGALMERNLIFNITVGVYHDAFPGTESIARKNYGYNCYLGIKTTTGAPDYTWLPPYQNLPQEENPTPDRRGTGTGSGSTITITPNADPKLEPGTVVQLYNLASIGTKYYGMVSSSTETSLEVNQIAGASGLAGNVAFWPVTQQKKLTIEGNIIDLSLMPLPIDNLVASPPEAIQVMTEFHGNPSVPTVPFPLVRDLVIRNNYIRTIDNKEDPYLGKSQVAVRMYAVERAVVEGNVTSRILAPVNAPFAVRSFTFGVSNRVHTFNNRMIDGTRLRMRIDNRYADPNWVGREWVQDIEDEIEDWMLNC